MFYLLFLRIINSIIDNVIRIRIGISMSIGINNRIHIVIINSIRISIIINICNIISIVIFNMYY